MNLRPFLLTCLLAAAHSTQAADTLKHSIPPHSTVPQTGAELGSSVAISSAYFVAGSPLDDAGAEDSGQVRVFDTSTGALLHTINNPSPADGDKFGAAVATVNNWLMVSAPYDDTDGANSGQVYVYNLSSSSPTVPVATLVNPDTFKNGDLFGAALAVSNQRLVIGVSMNGAAYVYNLGGPAHAMLDVTLVSPTMPVTGDFGRSVAIQGTRVAVGAPASTPGVYLYDLAGATPTVPVHTFDNPAPPSTDSFGSSVALSSRYLVVGAPYDDAVETDAGAAYAYDLSSATPTTPIAMLYTSATSLRVNNHFGSSVTIHSAKVIVGEADGGSLAGCGQVHVFDLSSPTPAAPTLSLNNPTPDVNDYFGRQVAIVGNQLAIGSPGEDTVAPRAGAAYLYELAGGTPSTPVHTLMRASPAVGDAFGTAVAVSGTRVAVGAPYESSAGYDEGIVKVYDLAGATPTVPWLTVSHPTSDLRFGSVLAMSGNTLVIADNYGGTGKVLVFDLASGTPTVPVATLESSVDWNVTSLAVAGSVVVAGMAEYDENGRVVVFNLAAPNPSVPVLTLIDPTLDNLRDYFGQSVAISGTKIIVGSPDYSINGNSNPGRVYVYDLTSTTPAIPVLALQQGTAPLTYGFGHHVGISGNWLVAASQSEADYHKVYVFDLGSPTPGTPVLTLGEASMGAGLFDGGLAISGTRVVFGPYVYDLARATPGVPILTLSSPAYDSSDDGFANAVAIDGTTIVAGAPGCDEAAVDKGWAYVFGPPTTVTIPPTLTAPNSFTTHTSTLTVNFSLPEPALPGSVKLVFWNNTPATHVLTLATSQESMGVHSFTFSPANPTASPVFASTTQPLPDGHYSVGLSYQDADGSVAASSGVKTSVLIDVTAPTISAPAGGFSPTILVTPAVAPNYASQAVAYDAIGLSSVTQIPAPGAALPAGVTNVVITAVDTVGHSASTNASITVLRFTQDTDGDGLNDASEFQMAALGFNWQVAQPALVNTLMSNASGAGLYTTSQVQALNVGTPLISRNPTTGLFKLTIGVEKSTNLQTFTPFPMTELQTFINGAGKLDFYFTAPDNAAFFQIRAE